RATGQPLQTGDEPEVLAAGELLIDRGVLTGDSDELAYPMRVAGDVDAEDLRRSPADRQQGREHIDRRRLPRTVGAEESEDLPGADVEVDAVNGGEVAEGLAKSSDRHRWDDCLVLCAFGGRCACCVHVATVLHRGFIVVSGVEHCGFREDAAGFSQAYWSVKRTRKLGASRCDRPPTAMSDQDPHARFSWDGNTIGRMALLTAAAAGTVHGLFSLYWAVGGDWLLESLGADLIETFADSRWLLLPVGLAKIFAGVLPLLWARWAWPVPRLSRSACWVGAFVLVLWGGANTIVGNLVLMGVITVEGGYDGPGMVGHAWLWDPLFLLWGASLVLALSLTRQRRNDR